MLQNVVVRGNAGTAKTTLVVTKVSELISSNHLRRDEVLILTLNKEIQRELEDRFEKVINRNIRTVHSLVYSILNAKNMLPDKFKDSNEQLGNKDFNQLFDIVLNLSDEEIFATFTHNAMLLYNLPDLKRIKLIIVDEFQTQMIKTLKFIGRIRSYNDINIWMIGDEKQTLMNFVNKKSRKKIFENPFKNIKKYIGINECEEIIQTVNKRSTFEIQSFLNSYLRKVFKSSDEELYDLSKISRKGDKPVIAYFPNHATQYQYICEQIAKIQNENNKILILHRRNTSLKRFQKFFQQYFSGQGDMTNISTSSFHKCIGSDADICFIMDLCHDERDDGINMLHYVAISRPKLKLYITSSHPKADLDKLFDKDTYVLECNVQKKIEEGWKRFPAIKPDGYFTEKKLHQTVIDSLYFSVSKKIMPFQPHVYRSKVKQNPKQPTQIITNKEDFNLSVMNVGQCYAFRFKDINLLRRSSFNDENTVKYCLNQTFDFFDGRICRDDINLTRIDLCQFHYFEDKEQLNDSVKKLLLHIIDMKEISSIKAVSSLYYKGRNISTKEDVSRLNPSVSTMYLNLYNKKSYGMTIVIYPPNIKDNDNRINNKDRKILKVEIRLKSSSFMKTKDVFGKKMIGSDIINLSKSNLKDLFYNLLNTFLGEKSFLFKFHE